MLWLLLLPLALAVPISTCFEITSPGVYTLTNDLGPYYGPELACINITTNDVVLDLNGFSIIGNYSINVTSSSNLTITNGVINYSRVYLLNNFSNLTLFNVSFDNHTYAIYSYGNLTDVNVSSIFSTNDTFYLMGNVSFHQGFFIVDNNLTYGTLIVVENGTLKDLLVYNNSLYGLAAIGGTGEGNFTLFQNITYEKGGILVNLTSYNNTIVNQGTFINSKLTVNSTFRDFLVNGTLGLIGNAYDVDVRNMKGTGTTSAKFLTFTTYNYVAQNVTIKNTSLDTYDTGIVVGGPLFTGPGTLHQAANITIKDVKISNVTYGILSFLQGFGDTLIENVSVSDYAGMGFMIGGSLDNNVLIENVSFYPLPTATHSIAWNIGGIYNYTIKNMFTQGGVAYGILASVGYLLGPVYWVNLTFNGTAFPMVIDVAYRDTSGRLNVINTTAISPTVGFASPAMGIFPGQGNFSTYIENFYTNATEVGIYIDLYPYYKLELKNVSIISKGGVVVNNTILDASLNGTVNGSVFFWANNSIINLFNSTLEGNGQGIYAYNSTLNISDTILNGFNRSIEAIISNSYWKNVEGLDFMVNGTTLINSENLTLDNVKMCSQYSNEGFYFISSNNISGTLIGNLTNVSSNFTGSVSPCIVLAPPSDNRNNPPSIEIISPHGTYNSTTILFHVYGTDDRATYLFCEYNITGKNYKNSGDFELYENYNFTETLNPGTYRFDVVCDDGQNGYDSDSSTFRIIVPNITITGNLSNNTTQNLTNGTLNITNNTSNVSLNGTNNTTSPNTTNSGNIVSHNTSTVSSGELTGRSETEGRVLSRNNNSVNKTKPSNKTSEQSSENTSIKETKLENIKGTGSGSYIGAITQALPSLTLIIPLLILLIALLRVARLEIRDKSIKLKTLWGSPLKNVKVIINKTTLVTDEKGEIKTPSKLSKKDIKVPGYLLI